MKEIADRVYRIAFWMGYLNVYVIDTGDGLALVDTGVSADHVDGIVRGLRSIGRTMADVRHILITHAHFDHTGGLWMAQKQTKAKTYAHRREALVIRGEQPVIYANPETLRGLAWLTSFVLAKDAGSPARVDVEVQAGDVLDDVLPGLQVIDLMGHSLGQVGYWWADRRILFGGDVMIRYPWGLRMPLAAPSPDWEAAKRSIQHVAALDVDTLCLGHGAPIRSGAAAEIHKLAGRLKPVIQDESGIV